MILLMYFIFLKVFRHIENGFRWESIKETGECRGVTGNKHVAPFSLINCPLTVLKGPIGED